MSEDSRNGCTENGTAKVVHHLRIARPVSDIERAARMYCEGLKLRVLSEFRDHEGFDGIMVGLPGADYHFEFTFCRRHPISPTAGPEDLLVFYFESGSKWQHACADMQAAGFVPVDSFNPYWSLRGRTYQDLDGYRVVLQEEAWSGGYPNVE